MPESRKGKAGREIRLYYLDGGVQAGEIEGIIRTVWEDIHDLEFDHHFGRFRGIHREGEVIHVTWENSYGARFVSSIIPGQDHTRIDYCPDGFYDIEERARNMEEEGNA
jgi:hypothetical protein